MFLYELAVALDKRSPEIIEAAATLGLGQLQPATDLDPQQVAALRAHFGSAAPPPHAGPYFSYPVSDPVSDPPEAAAPPPVAPAQPSPDTRLSKGQRGLIAATVVLVAALAGFMALNTGPDKGRERALAAKDAALEAELNATAAAPKVTATSSAPTPTVAPAQDVYEPVDVAKFCAGGIAVSTFELRLVAAMADQDFAELSSLVSDRREAWNDDVATLASGAAPILRNDIELYQSGYNDFFDAIESSSTFETVQGKVDQLEIARSANAAKEFGTQVVFECE